MKLLQIIQIVQIIVAILLIAVVSIQGKGAGLSATFGGGAMYSTRRGAERFVFYSTIILGILFAGLSLATLFI